MKRLSSRISVAILPLLSLMLTVNAWGQLEFPEDKVNWKFTVEQNGEDATVVGTITMDEHWHIYAANLPDGVYTLPTEIVLDKSSNYKTIGKIVEPKPTFVHDDLADEDLYYHSHTVKMKQKIKVLSKDDFKLKGSFTFQTCDDTHCLPPYTAEFTVDVKGVNEEEQVEDESIENSFVKQDGDFAVDDKDVNYVRVDDKWFAVPAENTPAFYKKYLTLGGSHDE